MSSAKLLAAAASAGMWIPTQQLGEYEDVGDGFRLVQVHVVSRHGMRTPVTAVPEMMEISWDCSSERSGISQTFGLRADGGQSHCRLRKVYTPMATTLPGTCFMGQLTAQGAYQMRQVGEYYRRVYKDRLGFLSGDPDEAYLRSTDIPRTIESLQALLLGLYGGEGGEYVVHTRDAKAENMFGRSGCKMLQELKRKLHDTEAYVRATAHGDEELYRALGVSKRSVQGLNNTIESIILHADTHLRHLRENIVNPTVPPGPPSQAVPGPSRGDPLAHVDEDLVFRLRQRAGYQLGANYRDSVVTRLSIGRFLREVHEAILAGSAGRGGKKKFYLYMGHDNTLAPLLGALSCFDGLNPPIGAQVVLEVFAKTDVEGEFYVRLLYNGRPLNLASAIGAEYKGGGA
eukprot:CAMPEP_0119127236 /NCGR_PEP_ID=MMETSP1310-20130426/5863_1 /TAXON_ID=464262 /ORGANISM="Genus nov. species nov., Strain RCC2339" /LENGTH=400 /DNA_ID=CAMNT_0007117481 /DNA_START=92 /DNA_END=1290 /DNA_ORIENTATION=+